jgi:hypothetical protein
LEIFSIDTATENNLGSFLADFLPNPLTIYGVSNELFIKHALSELSDCISTGGFILVAKEEGKVVGLIALKRSEWDTKHFDIEISKIDQLLASGNYSESTNIKQRLVSSLLAKCSKELLLHVSARVNKEDLSSIHALESKNFRLMDILVTYSVDLRKHPRTKINNQYCIRAIRKD